MEKDLDSVVSAFMKKYELDAGDTAVCKLLAHYFDALVFNTVSLACMTALLHGKRKIGSVHIAMLTEYIRDKCGAGSGGAQKGGSVTGMPSDYFGYPHPAYGAPAGHDSAIDFDNGIARPQIGGAAAYMSVFGKEPIAKKLIKAVAAHHHMEVSRECLKGLERVLDIHLACFAKDLKGGRALTKSGVERVANLRRHAIFH